MTTVAGAQMTDSRNDPDPYDPRVQEEIRNAVKRTRGSAFGSYLEEQDLAKATQAKLANVYGSGLDAAMTSAIRHEMNRQTWTEAALTTPDMTILPGDIDNGPPARLRPSPDPLAGLRADHWFTGEEMRSLRQCAFYPRDMLRRRYDPDRRPNFYRGYVVALTALAKGIGPEDSVQRYWDVIEHTGAMMRTWPGTKAQAAGVRSGLANAFGLAGSGNPVSALAVVVRMEIACGAECFHLARQRHR